MNRVTLISGYIVPSHGAIHVGYDNKESVKEDYEVLCEDQPCSLRYLASKKIRDQVPILPKFIHIHLRIFLITNIFVICTFYIFVSFKQYMYVVCKDKFFYNHFELNFWRILVKLAKLGLQILGSEHLVGFIFHKFVRNFKRICKKTLQMCVKL
jgi:hypothetical protein